MKAKEEVISLNVRIPVPLRRAFDVEVAKRGITKQEAMEEALSAWTLGLASAAPLPPFPVFPSKSSRKFNITPGQIDEASIG